MTDFNEELRKVSHVTAAWETAMQAMDYAIKESALYDILTPSDQEVLMLREFAHAMQDREAGLIAALNAVRATLPKEYVIVGAAGHGTSRLGTSNRRARRGR